MDERDIPIDINIPKLLDWLISRRHIQKDWQNNILKIREKINNAIQDMPPHEDIIRLVSGQHIHYFNCLKIIEILKKTEADTKNIFGQYGSQRMKDWKDIVSSYEKDNLYLAEAAQMLVRNYSYEIPSLKKQISKLYQSHTEYEKKIKDYEKTETTALKDFEISCHQLGIKGKNIKEELLHLLHELPDIYQDIALEIRTVKSAMELYREFNQYLSGKPEESVVDSLNILKYLIEQGNTTTYEYIHGQKPLKVEVDEKDKLIEILESTKRGIAWDDNDGKIGFSTNNAENESIDFGDTETEEVDIDWGTTDAEGFEIISHQDVDINLEESGIVVEKSGVDGGVARGEEALKILDNPKSREQIINNLMELDAFLEMRLFEMSMDDSDILAMSQMQDAPIALQIQNIESVVKLRDTVNIALSRLTDKRLLHLHNIKHSPNYVDTLTASLQQKLSVAERMNANKKLLNQKIRETEIEFEKNNKLTDIVTKRLGELALEITKDISKKYKGRKVNLVGLMNL